MYHQHNKKGTEQDPSLKLWYRQPAGDWTEALPIGNGRLGGMVFGGIDRERIQLNEDTLWSGQPRDTNNYQAIDCLKKARELIFHGEYTEAQSLMEQHMLGPYGQSYQPLGNLYLEFDGADAEEEEDYVRELDLDTAIARVQYSRAGSVTDREAFVSAPDQAVILRIRSDQPGGLSMRIYADSLLKHRMEKISEGYLSCTGQCPCHTDPEYIHKDLPIVYEENKGIFFDFRIRIKASGGCTRTTETGIRVFDADSVTVYLTAATSFNGFDRNPATEGKPYRELAANAMNSVFEKPYDVLKERHRKDYQGLYNRVFLDLGTDDAAKLPTDQRLEAVKAGGDDPSLAALMFQYGRYLLISSSRPGTQPANLQGIWNREMRPPWSSNYTTNINTEMNYWPAEVCNLAECHEPLFAMVEELQVTGSRTARAHYGARGWTVHHNVDLWRLSSPVGGSAGWAFWPMAGVWLCRHLWEHYLFGGDRDFLRDRAYPAMKGAALFCLDWLVEDGKGHLTTCPSTSPENAFVAPTEKHATSVRAVPWIFP